MKFSTKHSLPVTAFSAKSTRQKIKFLLFSLLLMCFITPAFSQDNAKITISGIVTDSAGGALSQVTVAEKGTKNAVITGADGAYSIAVKGQTSTLVFSSVGFLNKEFRVGSKTSFMLSLERDTKDLNEVVVVGYGARKKESLTGALSQPLQQRILTGYTVALQ